MQSNQCLRFLRNAAVAVFCAFFLLIFVQIYLFNDAFGYSPLLQGVLMACWLAAVGTLWLLLERRGGMEALLRHKYLVLGAVLLFIFAVQLYVGFATRQTLNHDYGKVFNGAVLYTLEGRGVEEFAIYDRYLHHWPNNMGQFVVLISLFRALHALGLSCFYEATMVMGHLLFSLAIGCTFLYLDKAFSTRAAFGGLLLFGSFLVLYAQSSIGYTDTFSVWVIPAVLTCCEYAKTAKRRTARIALYALTGLLLAIGTAIKGSVLIIAIAVFLELLLCGEWKRLLAFALAAGLVFAGASALFDRYNEAILLDPARVERESYPVTFWIMMGLAGENGTYTPVDEMLTDWGTNQAERRAINIDAIKGRIAAMGPTGYLHFLHKKTTRSFGSGNGDISYMMSRGPEHPERLIYQFLLPEGQFYRYFDNLSQAVYLLWYPLGLAGAALALRRRDAALLRHPAPFLGLCGFYAFMLLWESNHRQLINQWPLFVIVAAVGLASLLSAAEKKLPKRAKLSTHQ